MGGVARSRFAATLGGRLCDDQADGGDGGGKSPYFFDLVERVFISIVFNLAGSIYRHVANKFELVAANERGHYPIHELGVELGIWQGIYQNLELPWLRRWDSSGNLLLTGWESSEQERQKVETLMVQLRTAGIEPQL